MENSFNPNPIGLKGLNKSQIPSVFANWWLWFDFKSSSNSYIKHNWFLFSPSQFSTFSISQPRAYWKITSQILRYLLSLTKICISALSNCYCGERGMCLVHYVNTVVVFPFLVGATIHRISRQTKQWIRKEIVIHFLLWVASQQWLNLRITLLTK